MLRLGILSPPGPFLTPSPSSQQILQPSISPSPIQLPFQQQHHHQPQQIVTPTVQQQLNHHPHQQQDGLLVVTTNNTTTFLTGTASQGTTTTHDQVQDVQRVKTPNRRASLTQSIQSSPNAGGTAVTYRPSPTQSPAHLSTSSTTVSSSSTTTYNSNSFGTVPAGHEFNTTLVGSNNISLNKVRLMIFE